MRRYTLCLSSLLLAACGQDSSPATGTAAAETFAAMPADARLAKLYTQTCRSCHTSPASGAPQSGDKKAWEPRAAQGMPVLIDHTINGYKGMPPLGACMDCTEKEFEALIRFMAGMDS